MNPDAVEALLAKVPTEIRVATKPLGSDRCWAALILLLDNDAGLRIGELEQSLGGDRAEILPVMRALTQAGLASLVAPTLEDIGSLDTSYYRASLLGKSLVRGLYSSILPQPERKMESQKCREPSSDH
jgi:hypothetical protein